MNPNDSTRAVNLLSAGLPILSFGMVTTQTIAELAASRWDVPILDRPDMPPRTGDDIPRVLGKVLRIEARADGRELWAVVDAKLFAQRLSFTVTFQRPQHAPATPQEALRMAARVVSFWPPEVREALVLARYIGDPAALARLAIIADRLTIRPTFPGLAIRAKRAELLGLPEAEQWMRLTRQEMSATARLLHLVADGRAPIEKGSGAACGGYVGWAKLGPDYRNGLVRATPEEAARDADELAEAIARAGLGTTIGPAGDAKHSMTSIGPEQP